MSPVPRNPRWRLRCLRSRACSASTCLIYAAAPSRHYHMTSSFHYHQSAGRTCQLWANFGEVLLCVPLSSRRHTPIELANTLTHTLTHEHVHTHTAVHTYARTPLEHTTCSSLRRLQSCLGATQCWLLFLNWHCYNSISA